MRVVALPLPQAAELEYNAIPPLPTKQASWGPPWKSFFAACKRERQRCKRRRFALQQAEAFSFERRKRLSNENEAVHPPLYTRYIRYRGSWLRPSDLTAHAGSRLMLLGPPPDMVHRSALRETRPSTLLASVSRYIGHPGAGIRPRYSGLRIQGTAGSPTSTAPAFIIRHGAVFIKGQFFGALQIGNLCYNALAAVWGRSSAGRTFGTTLAENSISNGYHSVRIPKRVK